MIQWLDKYFNAIGVLIIAGVVAVAVRAVQIEPAVDSALVIRNTVIGGK